MAKKKQKQNKRKIRRKTSNNTNARNNAPRSNKGQNTANKTVKTTAPVHNSANNSKPPTNQKQPQNTNVQQNKGIISKLVAVFIKDHKDNNNGHPHVIVDNVDNKHISVGLTTQKKKGQGRNAGTNYALQNNPLDPKGEPSYMRRQATIDNKNNYNNPRTGKMVEQDYEKAKEYGAKAKKKYLDTKNENKKE